MTCCCSVKCCAAAHTIWTVNGRRVVIVDGNVSSRREASPLSHRRLLRCLRRGLTGAWVVTEMGHASKA